VKPAPFQYERPGSLEEALHSLAVHGGDGKVLAGGQSLIPVMNFRLAQPAVLVDVNRLGELDFVAAGDGGSLRLGALVRQARLEREPAVARLAPLLAEAVPSIAHPQIRNRGTLGGSLAHADPAAELPAVMVALDARFRLAREGGDRWVPAAEFFGGLFATALEPEEMLVEVEIPPWPAGSGGCFLEVSRRHGDYAMVGVAARTSLGGDGRLGPSRLVYLSVGDAPVEVEAGRQTAAEAPSEELFAAVAHAAAGELEPASDIHASAEYRRHLAAVLARRALATAAARAAGESA
jgi:carbon-monoxide dehydrogenase medium subunit